MGVARSTHVGMRILYDTLIEKLKVKRQLGGQGADGRIIIKLISGNRLEECELDTSGSG
jgi:hypothetical protein